MRFFKEIFARIWALWGILTFIATFFIIFIPAMLTYLLPDPVSARIFTGIARVWMTTWLFLIACPLRVRGKQYFEKGKAFIVTCNHNSLMDIPLSSPFIPGPNKTIAKKSFTKIPLFGWYYAKGSVLVDRNSERSRRKSFEDMKQVLRMGMHMCIYPEGTRNRGGEPLKKFYDGAFKLSVDTKAPVIPTVIFNTAKVLPLHKTFYFLPHRLEMHFLAPISPEGKTADQLKQEVFSAMYNHYTQTKR